MNQKTISKIVREVYAETNDFIPLHAPQFGGSELEYVSNTIKSTFVSSVGEYVNNVENIIAKRVGVSKAVAVVNGTAALHIALKLAGVKPDEEVITQSLTFIATVNAISYVFAKPVFVDVDRDTMSLSPQALSLFLQEYGERREDGTYNKKTGKRIGAVLPMHTFGFMSRMDEILEVCTHWGIPVIEDAAEAFGSEYKNRPAGSIGSIAAFSFNGNKVITAGGGGILIGSDDALMVRAKHITTTAKVPHAWEYVHDEVGYNYRMPNLNAALLSAQLERVDEFIENKMRTFELYKEFLSSIDVQVVPVPADTTKWNCWLMSIMADDRNHRDAILKETNESGVMTRPIWQLMYKMKMYEDCQRDEQQNAEYLADRIVNIPSSVR